MKKINLILLVLTLVMAMTLSFVSCAKDGGDDTASNGGEGSSGDGTNTETPPADDNADPENLVLIKDGKANFKVILAKNSDASIRKAVESFISNLKDIGVEVEALVNDSDASSVTDCEIIVGTGTQNRDKKYCLNARDYGEDGYEIKIVDNKVLIGGGTLTQTKSAFDYFVKNIIKLTSKTKELDEFKLERTYTRVKETKYLIESIEIAGTELSEYVFVSNADAKANAEIYNFREELYSASGYWLEKVDESSVPEGKKVFSVKLVDYAGKDGFRAYVDSDKNFVVECAYSNAISPAFGKLVDTQIFEKIGSISIGKSFEKTYPVNVVYYAQFGAKGDGTTEDYEAIYNAHAFANISGQKVMGDGPDAVYYIHAISKMIDVKTDVDWQGATFHLDDTGSEVFVQRSHIFQFSPSLPVKEYDAKQLEAKFGNTDLHFGDTEIPWLVGEIDTTCFIYIRNNHKDYIRWGGNISSGQNRRDVVVIEPDGKLHEDTPIAFDFVAGQQMLNNGLKLEVVNTAAIEYMAIYRADEKPLTMENGYFERKACEVVAETGYENKYEAYGRGISIQRCNVTVKNVHHKIVSEPYLPNAGYGYDDDMKLRHSYPYGGFLAFYMCYNSKAINCDLNAHTTYYEAKTTSASPIAMGTYDLTVGNAANIYLEGLTNGVPIGDTQYWGIMCSNGGKNLDFYKCSLNRFDAHEGFWNASLIDCEYGHTINVIGGGRFFCENTTKEVGTTFISLRGDYGSHFNGTIELVNCTLKGMQSYRGQSDVKRGKHYDDGTPMTIIAGTYHDVYQGEFNPNEASSFPFLKWDFGYVCHMPQHLIIDNFTFDHGTPTIYWNIGDDCFNKPSDFVQKTDYEGKTINGRPMTADDVYYNQYMITQSITFKNMEPIPVCSHNSSYLYKTLTPKIVVEND